MPTYLCHGFRWRRRSIRVYVVVQNLDDAAPEWIIKQGSARNLIESFYNLFDFLPECTFPPTRSSSRAPGSRSISKSASQTSMSLAAYRDEDDDDDASYHTTRSGRSRGRSLRDSKSTATLHQQFSQAGNQTTSASRRPSSNSSRKRSEAAGPSIAHSMSSRAALTYQAHHAPPSPPSSQPGYNFALQPSDPSVSSDPVLAQNWAPVKLLEEYDPANLDEVSRPYAYVADYVTRIDDSCSIAEEIQKYEARVRRESVPPVTGTSSDDMLNGKRDTSKLGRRAGWFEKLRDQLQRGEDIRWYVVVIGDEERAWTAQEAKRSGSRSSVVHHKQYTHQQLIFEAQDRDLETRREQLRKELGYEQGGVDRLMERNPERRPKPPQKELPPLRTKGSLMSSIISASPRTPKSPKSPGRASLRRLFSRSKTEEATPT